jgi:ATP-dependent helicase/nuclease subunit A
MGAYADALAQIWPSRTVETAILWTRNATLMPLPGARVADALARAGHDASAAGDGSAPP